VILIEHLNVKSSPAHGLKTITKGRRNCWSFLPSREN